MKVQMEMIPITGLVAHERVSKKRVHELIRLIRKDNLLRQPILVSRDRNVVLDGHHRLEAMKQLNARYIPAYVIDYYSEDVSVTLRRERILERILKKGIIAYAGEGKLFPYKTTRHVVRARTSGTEVTLDSCK